MSVSPGLFAMYGALAWTVAGLAFGLIVGAAIRIADLRARRQSDHELVA